MRWSQLSPRIAVVAHGGVLDCIYRFAMKLSLHEPRSWPLLNCSVNVADYANGGATVVSWSDIAHLSTDTDDDSLRKRASVCFAATLSRARFDTPFTSAQRITGAIIFTPVMRWAPHGRHCGQPQHLLRPVGQQIDARAEYQLARRFHREVGVGAFFSTRVNSCVRTLAWSCGRIESR